MKIIKQDLKLFYKPILIYIFITQVLWALGFNVVHLDAAIGNYPLEYLSIFIITLVTIATISFTALLAIYYCIKSTSSHKNEYQLTDGYGLYRFITSVMFILFLVVNYCCSLVINNIFTVNELLSIDIVTVLSSLFLLLPLLCLVIISIAKAHNQPVFKNFVALLSMFAILLGLYIAGNLYYFGNPKQGAAVLLVLFIPLAILYSSYKIRDSQKRGYKLVIVLFCLIILASSSYFVYTSELKYVNPNDYSTQIEPSTDQHTIEAKQFDTEYGPVSYAYDQTEEVEIYTLVTSEYLYHLYNYSEENVSLTAYKLTDPSDISIYTNQGQAEPEVVANIYDTTNATHTLCTSTLAEIDNQFGCDIDQEVLEVYNQVIVLLDRES